MNESLIFKGSVGIEVVPVMPAQLNEGSFPHGMFRLEKFRAKRDGSIDRFLDDYPNEVITNPNAYVNAGGVALLTLLIGGGGTAFNAANAYLGAGDSSTNATPLTYTDLQAASNKVRKAMDSTYPSIAGQVCTFKSTFTTSDGNWAWNEVAIFNAAAAGTMLARSVASYGTKSASASWVLTYTLTVP